MLLIISIFHGNSNKGVGGGMKYLNESNKLNICVITTPGYQSIYGATPTILSNFIDVLEPLSNELFIITGKFPNRQDKRIRIVRIKGDAKRESIVIRILKFVMTQIRISYNLVKIYKNIDVVIFFLGTRTFPLPMLLLKLLKKKTVLIAVGSIIGATYVERTSYIRRFISSHIPRIFAELNYALSDKIIVYSENLIDKLGLEKYKNKILVAHEHFLDFDKFKIKKKLDERNNLVGYIGRLSEEKGTLNFVRAIPEVLILKGKNKIRFLVGGDGSLQDKVREYLREKNLQDKVKLTGWILHDELSDYLNKLKLLVLPSYTEGLPNIMLEAMACGTPVLATPVGAIPDVIKDGETGFILEDNSPECIARNVIRVLNYPNLDKIVKNARELVKKEFTHKAAVERYRKILASI